MNHWKRILPAFILASFVCCLMPIEGRKTPLQSASAACLFGKTDLILDAGHGGEDGGAVSAETGAVESQINLAIVLKIRDILGLYGSTPVLLREDDRSLHDPNCVTLREKKRSDLINRVDTVNSLPGAALLSIHQNSFPDGKYHGTQAFYAQTDGSRELAEHIQRTVSQTLQPENRREAKLIPDSVYLMNHVHCRAVLIECGFLTNREEAHLLQTDTHQRKLASVISAGWLTGQGT